MDKQGAFIKFLCTAPVITTIWMFVTAGILIEFNRFFPDLLFHPLQAVTSLSVGFVLG